ncbi:E3 ubiquitin-protein ligase WAV3-like [Curcuma longa]|uniref:E3 ubiquitin-protein ligase WAV3-like n=1 Tax=Curcuma longa TaxID=136217 RepID=UPI003D9E8D47
MCRNLRSGRGIQRKREICRRFESRGQRGMGTGGWRRAFCTAVGRDTGATEAAGEKKQQQRAGPSRALSCAKLSFFSGDRDGCSASPELRCRTKSNGCSDAPMPTASTRTPTAAAVATTARRRSSPAPFHRKDDSAPSSLRSASEFGLFQHLSKNRCRICWQSLRASQEVPVFTAECSHAFHFPCIAAHVRAHGSVACPICSAAWRQAPFLSAAQRQEEDTEQVFAGEADNRNPNRRTSSRSSRSAAGGREPVKLYDDDEPLLLAPKPNQGGVRFNPIPEVTNEDDMDEECSGEKSSQREDEFLGLLAGTRRETSRSKAGGVHVTAMPQTALLSKGRRHWNYVVAIKVKAPALRPSKLLDQTRGRAPIDLVMVLDVSYGMTGEKLQMQKRAMRLVASSLGSADRLSIVAFSASAGPKRLLPLRRMSRRGQRAARHIVERLVAVDPPVESASIGDALRKATKVLEDRRERNPVATIMLLSDASRNLEESKDKLTHSPRDSVAANTRFARLEIPAGFPKKQSEVPSEDAFIKCVGGLVSVVMQDVCLQLEFPSGEICAVYPSGGGGSDVTVGTGGSVLRLGDLYAEEERELLVELRMAMTGEQQIERRCLSAKCKYRDPATHNLSFDEEQLVPLPSLRPDLRDAASLRLRDAFVTTRAMVESKRLVEDSEFSTANRLLSSARALVLQSASDAQDTHLVRLLDGELAEVRRRREVRVARPKEEAISPAERHRQRRGPAEVREESLTPTSAWRAAEQLAKVAIMRKSLNRVSDLHGFENARF